MADVFISYAREDRDRARELAVQLEGRGWTVWWDRKLVAGQNFDEVLTGELKAARSVVVLWSHHSIESVWVKNEATFADRRGVLIPTRIANVDLPMPFQLKETVDLSRWDGAAGSEELQFLFESIAVSLTGQPAPGGSLSTERNEGMRPPRDREGSTTTARRLSLLRRPALIAGLGVALVAGLVTLEWRALAPSLSTTARLSRVGGAGSASVPLDSMVIRRLQDVREQLSESLRPDLLLPDPQNASVLAVAQVVIACADELGATAGKREEIATFFRAAAKADCNCWSEVTKPQVQLPDHIPTSAWILYAMAEIGVPATDAEVSFLLNEQAPAGWWSFFPVGDERFASTYATAWALLALEHQRSRDLLGEAVASKVSSALARGSDWLVARREHDAVLWKDYPYLSNGRISRSISGVALYALHDVAPRKAAPLETRWLDVLAHPPAAGEGDTDYYWIDTRAYGSQLESFMHIDLNWMLVATADAYDQGGRVQRARALAWIEEALDQPSVAEAASRSENWWRAELLIAVNHVLRRAGEDAGEVTGARRP